MTSSSLGNIEKLETDLWEAADNLRANSKLTSSEYCMPVLGVIFLRHAANRFEAAAKQIEAALKDIRDVVEAKLQQMMATNPLRMDFYKKYQEIIADYNREKDRVTIEETFARLLALAESLDVEQKRAVEEGLSENELALFDLLTKPDISKTARELVKQSSRSLLAAIQTHLKNFEDWTAKEQTQADIRIFVLDQVFESIPQPPYTPEEAEQMAERVYEYVFQKTVGGRPLMEQAAA